MELCLNIDEHGRTVAPPPTEDETAQVPPSNVLDYTTKSFQLEQLDEKTCDMLIQDCKVITQSDLPLTFWLSAKDEPRCLLERFAKDIFMYHTKKLKDIVDSSNCGCEWWVQFRPTTNSNRINSGSREAQRGIEFHWDKDEALRDAAGVFVHPHLSTVTYLTDGGAPTIVFDDSIPDEALIDREMKNSFISWPRRGKHLVFDGRFLHGAPSDLLSEKETVNLRVTFLVNIWLHHKPLGIESFPEGVLRQLKKDTATSMRIISAPCSRLDVDESLKFVNFEWSLGQYLSIKARLPVNIIHDERKKWNQNGNITVASSSSGFAFIRTSR